MEEKKNIVFLFNEYEAVKAPVFFWHCPDLFQQGFA